MKQKQKKQKTLTRVVSVPGSAHGDLPHGSKG